MIMGIVADATSITLAFFVPVACICYLTFLGVVNIIKSKKI